MYRIKYWWMLSCAATVLAGCVADTDPVGVEMFGIEAGDPATHSADFELLCDQMVSFVPVDPQVARELVPSEFELYIENGLAQILLVMQDCSHAAWDGVELAPLQMVHVWIRRAGPFEVIPIPGAQLNRPSFYWYQHGGWTTSHDLFVRFKRAGMSIAMAESIALGAEGDSVRHATVVEKDLPTGAIGFDWDSVRTPYPPPGAPPGTPWIWGINHHIVGYQGWTPEEPDGAEKVLQVYDRGYIVLTQYGSPTIIRPHPRSDLAEFGSVLYGMSLHFELHFTATLTATELSE